MPAQSTRSHPLMEAGYKVTRAPLRLHVQYKSIKQDKGGLSALSIACCQIDSIWKETAVYPVGEQL